MSEELLLSSKVDHFGISNEEARQKAVPDEQKVMAATLAPTIIAERTESAESTLSTGTSASAQSSSTASSSGYSALNTPLTTPMDEINPVWMDAGPKVNIAGLDPPYSSESVIESLERNSGGESQWTSTETIVRPESKGILDGAEKSGVKAIEITGTARDVANASELVAYIESKTSIIRAEEKTTPKGLKAVKDKAKAKAKELAHGLWPGNSANKQSNTENTLEAPVPAVPPNTPLTVDTVGETVGEETIRVEESDDITSTGGNSEDVGVDQKPESEIDSDKPVDEDPECLVQARLRQVPSIYTLPNEQIEVEREEKEIVESPVEESAETEEGMELKDDAVQEVEPFVMETGVVAIKMEEESLAAEGDRAEEEMGGVAEEGAVEDESQYEHTEPKTNTLRSALATTLRVVLLLPWCVIVGASILLFPNQLEQLGFGLGYNERPTKAIHRFAYWANYAPMFVTIFFGFMLAFCWFLPELGALVVFAMIAQFVNAWHEFVPDMTVRLGEDDRNTIWVIWKGWGLFGAAAGECRLEMRNDGDSFVVEGFRAMSNGYESDSEDSGGDEADES